MGALLLVLIVVTNASPTAVTAHKVDLVCTGYKFTEGPVWAPWGKLLFTDSPADQIWQLDNPPAVYRSPSRHANGITFDRAGRLVACEQAARQVTRTEKDGTITVLADRFEGKRLNAPNDVVVCSDGSVYFTDPTYGVKPDDRELDFQGLYRISPDGKLSLLVKDFQQPNGLCFSPDEKKLYIADSSSLRHVRVFDVSKDGGVSNGRVFAVLPGEKGVPDGMKADVRGRLYVAGAEAGICVFNTDGSLAEVIALPEAPANLAWGDADGKTLYATARKSVYKLRMDVGGRPPQQSK